MTILESLEEYARGHPRVNGKTIRIDNILVGKSIYTMKDVDRVFDDMNFCLVLLEEGYGFAYFQEEPMLDFTKLVNRNVTDVLNETLPRYVRISLLDALYSVINMGEPSQWLKGSLRMKASKRARIILNGIPRGSKILILGAATEIIEEARRRECEVTILELEPQKIGMRLQDIPVQDGVHNELETACKGADYVVATGMIFVTGSEEQVFRSARMNGANLYLYMETGANFGEQLLKFGAKKVLAERFPFYDFCGNTRYRRFSVNQLPFL